MTRLSLLSLIVCISITFYGQVYSLDKMLHGLNYDMRQGPDWDPNLCKPPAVIEKDFKILKTITNNIRTYSLSGCDIKVILKTAKSVGLTVWLGVWVAANETIFDDQVEVLKELVNEGLIDDNVVGFNVGSEAVYRKDITPEKAITYLNKFKEVLASHKLTTPVSITDIGDVLYAYPAMIEAGDVITLNAFPFWEKIPADKGAAYFKKRIQPLLDLPQAKGKKVIISETGYATGGHSDNASKTSHEAAARYLNDFILLAEEMGWDYYYFCAFDTTYKKEQSGEPETVEAHFGIFTETGEMKPHYTALEVKEMTETLTETESSTETDTETSTETGTGKSTEPGTEPGTDTSKPKPNCTKTYK